MGTMFAIQEVHAMVQIKLPDGTIKEYPDAVTPREIAASIGKRLAEAVIAAVADGTIVDLDRPLEPSFDADYRTRHEPHYRR